MVARGATALPFKYWHILRGAWGVGRRRRRRRYWALSQHPQMHGRAFAPLQVIRVWELATGIQSMTTLLESDWENARRAHWPRVRCTAVSMAPNSTRAGVGCSVGSLILLRPTPPVGGLLTQGCGTRCEVWAFCTHTRTRVPPIGLPLPLDRSIDPNRLFFFFGASPAASAPPAFEPLPKPAYLPPWLGGRSADRASFLVCRPAKYAPLLAALSSSASFV